MQWGFRLSVDWLCLSQPYARAWSLIIIVKIIRKNYKYNRVFTLAQTGSFKPAVCMGSVPKDLALYEL